MSTRKAATQEPTVSLINHFTHALARSFTLGVDEEGYTHHYYQSADAVVVHNGRDLDYYQPLNGRPLTHWQKYVAQKRGWESFGQLAHAGLRVDVRQKEARI
ncbi:hypothetical protein [Haloprofundus sp. MHR1]|uniref:hypothetical protein n=1 Tax=Haloprofundus sp. MHR1 TaxID=2572921 RepID=UPI0010BF303A|nr:hypothetical protein [Haloprofundus sp. MHR1]QCJ45964.1 hypothetical protein FCF25_01990 [Haloprofundus sp. MHR1]